MDVQYFGHSSFKLRGKNGTVVTDPYDEAMVGMEFPRVSADVVTVSHDHGDHNQADQVSGTARREEPYVITAPGEYEVQGIGVFGWRSYHDDSEGAERGLNTIYVIHVDGVRICHLGDLGHKLSSELVDNIGEVDVLLVPCGGVYTIDAKQAAAVTAQLQPGYVIPMHYKTDKHKKDTFAELTGVAEFLHAMNVDEVEPEEKFRVSPTELAEETEVVVLSHE